MNRAKKLVNDETELGREKDHIRKELQVNGYPDQISDQLDPGQEEGGWYRGC